MKNISKLIWIFIESICIWLYITSEFGVTVVILIISCLFHLILSMYRIFTEVVGKDVRSYISMNLLWKFRNVFFLLVAGILFFCNSVAVGNISFHSNGFHHWTMSHGFHRSIQLSSFSFFMKCETYFSNSFSTLFQAKKTVKCVCELMQNKHDIFIVSLSQSQLQG